VLHTRETEPVEPFAARFPTIAELKRIYGFDLDASEATMPSAHGPARGWGDRAPGKGSCGWSRFV